MKSVLLWLVPWLAVAQQATTSGQCSPIAPNNSGSITINCPGLSRAQGEELLKIVNKILVNQTDLKEFSDKLDAILRGINDIRKSSADRHLTEQQKTALVAMIVPFKGERVIVSAIQNNPEAYHFAQEFVSVFRSAGIDCGV